MQLNGQIHNFPKIIKSLIGAFVIVLSIGFYTGLLFVGETSSVSPQGIEEQYLGNEFDENAKIMKFKKGEKEMLSLFHSHVLSMAMIFFFIGLILYTTILNNSLKLFLIIEPFFSVILTFGGIYLLWKGVLWMKYIVMLSGALMVICYTIAIIIILKQLVKKRSIS